MNILIVEDEERIASFVERGLEAEGSSYRWLTTAAPASPRPATRRSTSWCSTSSYLHCPETRTSPGRGNVDPPSR